MEDLAKSTLRKRKEKRIKTKKIILTKNIDNKGLWMRELI
jgi:hypothetical protein